MNATAARPAPTPTVFGSLADYRKGGVQVIDDSAKNCVFSNVFETAANSAPWVDRDFIQRFDSEELMGVFRGMVSDWTNHGYDPFAAPMETGTPWGAKNGGNDEAVTRQRVTARRMVGLPGDTPLRTDETGFPVNRMFEDVGQDQPEVHPEPGFENQVSAYDLFGYLARSDVTWNPSVCSVVRDSLFCPTTEEFILPVEHGNDRCEWFIQLSDEIIWDVKDGASGRLRGGRAVPERR